jgi:hypothetical protein
VIAGAEGQHVPLGEVVIDELERELNGCRKLIRGRVPGDSSGSSASHSTS